jgi:subtilisin family serine protease
MISHGPGEKRTMSAVKAAKIFLFVLLAGIVALGVGGLISAGGRTQSAGRAPAALASPGQTLAPREAALTPGRRVLTPGRRALASSSAPARLGPDQFRPGTVLVGFRPGVSAGQRGAIARAVGAYGARRLGPAIKPVGNGRVASQAFIAPFELRVPDGKVLSVVSRLRRDRAVAYAEPNYLQSGTATPNDPSFSEQWAFSNTGQAIPTQNAEEELGAPLSGTPGAEDGALKAWKVSTGSRSIVIGVVDTGIDLTHPDLAANLWSNPGGLFGCPAGTHGYNVVSKTCVPEDEDPAYGGHGTHVAGIMGAVGNNGQGVAGMNWQTTLLPVKWMHGAGAGETSALIEAMQYEVLAKQEGVNVRVVNDSDSFFGTAKSTALENEIEVLGANNILFVTSAGNTGNNNDEVAVQRYPCSYDKPTEICVTASNNKDELPSWANYGPHTVQLAAPGVSIYSTKRENGYMYLSGGSMASPQVAGAAALILSVAPTFTATQLKEDLEKNVDKLPSLSGRIITGGRLDVCKAMPGCEAEITAPPTNTSPPTLSGTAQPGQALSATTGVWENAFAYSYQWQRCNGRGEQCASISGATGQTYTVAPADVSSTLRVAVTATNTKGTAAPVSSAQTTVVALPPGTCGKTTVGAKSEAFSENRKRVNNSCTLAAEHTIEKLSIYLESAKSGQQVLEGVVYADSSGKPGALLGTTNPLTFTSTSAAGWYTLTFAAPLKLAAGKYWIGDITGATGSVAAFRFDEVASSRQSNENKYTSGPSKVFSEGGTVTTDSKQTSIYISWPQLSPPVNTVLPTVSGTAKSGQTLTVGTGSWAESPTEFAYQWQRCDTKGANCAAISGATGQTYTAVSADVGSTLEVAVTASNSAGSSSPASSAQTPVVGNIPPALAQPPAISGTAMDAQTLSAGTGTWSENPTAFAYQWQRCDATGANCSAISLATGQTYTEVSADVGSTLRVAVTATNSAGSSPPATSAQTAVVAPAPPANTARPTTSGTARDGQQLSATTGTWSGTPPLTYSYQWQDCNSLGASCANIPAATSSTYVLGHGDVGSTVRVTVTATNAGGEASSPSAQTAVIVPLAPANVEGPTISGTAKDGQTLGASTGTWSGTPPFTYTYQWQSCNNLGGNCANISGATSSTYALGHGDNGTRVQVVVTAKNAGGEAFAVSTQTAVVVAAAPSNVEAPTISGTTQDGQTLSASTGTWSGTPPFSYAYQWQSCNSSGENCAPITGATSSTYSLGHGDVGTTLRVIVTAKNSIGSVPGTSAVTEVVKPLAPSNTTLPTISGSAKDGQTLNAETGTWSGTPTLTYAYQWQRCNGSGQSCSNISGATSSSYLLTPSDVTNTLQVIVTATNGGGKASSTSAVTEVVKPLAPHLPWLR